MPKIRRSPVLLAALAAGLALLAGAALAQSSPPPRQDAERRDPAPAPEAAEPGKPAAQAGTTPGKAAPKQEAPKPRRGGKDPVREPEEEEDI